MDDRFGIVGMTVYGTPVLRVRNATGRDMAIELRSVAGDFAWSDTLGPGDSHIELPDDAAHVVRAAGVGCTLRPSARLPRHDGPIDRRARRQAKGLAAGTRVRTLFGAVSVEDLRIGDPVLCRDNGHRSLRWMARSGQGAEALHYPLLGCTTQVATDGGWMPAMDPATALRELPQPAREALLAANPQLRFTADRRPALPALDPAEYSCLVELA